MISYCRQFVWIAALGFGALQLHAQATADELYQEAVKAGRARDLAKSELWLKEMRASFPKDERAGIALIGVLGEQNKVPEALRLAREIAPQYRENAFFHLTFGQLLSKMNRYEEALSEYQAGLRSSKTTADTIYAHNLIGSAQRMLNQLDAAVESFQKAKRMSGKASFLLAVTLGMRGDREAEIAEYRAVLRETPNHDYALNNLAYSLAERGESLDEALSLARRAVQIAPGSSDAVDTLGWVLYKKGLFGDAEVELAKAALMEGGNEPAILEHLAKAMDGRAEWTDERRELRRLLENTENAAQVARVRTLLRKMQ